jgi:hypothetical protein
MRHACDDSDVAGDERLRAGSGDHYGTVRRVGDTVVRPVGDHSAAVQAFLKHLEAEGFDGAPRVVAATAVEESLTFVAGDVPVPPEPPSDGWPVVSTDRAVSVGALLARFHRAARTFTIPKDATWRGGFTHGVEHTVVCHNDPVVGNVVFRGEGAVALIDFAGPNDPVRNLAIAAQHWVPLGDPADVLAPAGWSPSDRLDGMCEAYGLPHTLRARLFDLVEDYLERGRLGVQARVVGGDSRFIAYWEAGLGDRLLRALRWLREEGTFLRGSIT